MVCPDIAFQLTDDLVCPAHVIRSFLFFIMVSFLFGNVKQSRPSAEGRPFVISAFRWGCKPQCIAASGHLSDSSA